MNFKYKIIIGRKAPNKMCEEIKQVVEDRVAHANSANIMPAVLFSMLPKEIAAIRINYPRCATPYLQDWKNGKDCRCLTIYASQSQYTQSGGYLLSVISENIV